MCRTATVAPDTFDHGAVSRFNAWFFAAFDRYLRHISLPHKRHAFADVAPGDIVELGAGVGANFEWFPPGSRVVAVEPSVAMHERLARRAAERGVDLEIAPARAESLPFDDASVDEVVSSLVLCTVSDPGAVLAEVRRVLRPGGRFRFVEHVAAPAWSPRAWLQRAIRRPWAWLFEGCDLYRRTEDVIRGAGFEVVDVERRRFRASAFVPVNTTIHGVAVR